MTTEDNKTIRVGVCGAAGKMGKQVIKAVLAESDLTLVMAVDTEAMGQDAAISAGLPDTCGVAIEDDLEAALASAKPQVVIDFTTPHVVFQNALKVLDAGGYCVIGTTGLGPKDLQQLEMKSAAQGTSVLIAPNFAIGGVLLMKFAQEASKYFDHAEIIELHHNQKVDAPSGTALRTAELMGKSESHFGKTNTSEDKELLLGARGGQTEGNIHIHSVRLPGLVAHQEVIFGDMGQTLTLRHDSIDRDSFMPGVILATRKIMACKGLVHGLENLL